MDFDIENCEGLLCREQDAGRLARVFEVIKRNLAQDGL